MPLSIEFPPADQVQSKPATGKSKASNKKIISKKKEKEEDKGKAKGQSVSHDSPEMGTRSRAHQQTPALGTRSKRKLSV